MSSRRRTRDARMYERWHTRAHTHTYTRRGYICIAETRRPCKFNICAVMEWSCRSGGNRVCAYLTQMLKLSYALQYHGKLRRIETRDESEKTVSAILKPWVYIPRPVNPIHEHNLFRERSIQERGKWEKKRGGDEKEN